MGKQGRNASDQTQPIIPPPPREILRQLIKNFLIILIKHPHIIIITWSLMNNLGLGSEKLIRNLSIEYRKLYR